MRAAALALATLVLATPLVAQSPRAERLRAAEIVRREPDYLSAAMIRNRTNLGYSARTNGTTLGMSADEQTAYMFVRRTEPSGTEVHSRWDDIVIVRSGRGAVLMGEQMTGGKSPALGERRDGTVIKPRRIVLGAGDIVRIPAAVPHSFEVNPREPLEYMLIKVRRADLPLR